MDKGIKEINKSVPCQNISFNTAVDLIFILTF